jgi:hypothetical protein
MIMLSNGWRSQQVGPARDGHDSAGSDLRDGRGDAVSGLDGDGLGLLHGVMSSNQMSRLPRRSSCELSSCQR